ISARRRTRRRRISPISSRCCMNFETNHNHEKHRHTLPWLYVRDEIDVLEGTFDRLTRRHRAAPKSPRRALEAAVLREQQDTERERQARVQDESGEPWIDPPERPAGVGCADD